jgi:ribosomal protein S18 acetylase RimI-like enzyme
MIEDIEKHSYLSTPATVESHLDGWLLRQSGNSIKRANSVNFPKNIVPQLEVLEKIEVCEQRYFSVGKASVFRVTPLACPENLTDVLVRRGYAIKDPTDVLTRPITGAERSQAPRSDVEICTDLTSAQFEALCHLTEKTGHNQTAFEQSLSHITIDKLFAFKYVENQIVSVGLATYSKGLLGLFEFATDPAFQRRGYGAEITAALMDAGSAKGAHQAYAQVVQENHQGQKFWRSQGFTNRIYGYQYFIKPMPRG